MKRFLFVIIALVCSCSSKNIPEYTILEDKVYDVPIKSQVTLHVALNDTIATQEQIKNLVELLVKESNEREMKYHNGSPTHIFIYVHKSKGAYNPDNWTDCIATYTKIGEDDKGKYTYKDTQHKAE